MTVLVTGGAGFIGANVVHRLLAAGEKVRVLDNLARPGVEKNIRWLEESHPGKLELIVADIRHREAVRGALKGVDHVHHFAAQVAVTTSIDDPIADFEVNATGTLQLLEAMRAMPKPPSLVFTSTNKVYGALEDLDLKLEGSRWVPADRTIAESGLSESRPLSFHSPYGCSKGTADQYVLDWARTYGLRTVVLRMSCIYGPRQFGNEDQGWVAHFLIRAMRGEPITIYGDGKQVRDILYVDDLVDAIERARAGIEKLAGRAFNIGGGPDNAVSLLELSEDVARHARRELRLSYADWRRADQRWYVSDTRAFTQATGWVPRTPKAEGMSRLAEWLGRQPENRPRKAAPAEASAT